VFRVVVTVQPKSKAPLSRAGLSCSDNLGDGRFCLTPMSLSRSLLLGSQPRSVAKFCANHEQVGNDSQNGSLPRFQRVSLPKGGVTHHDDHKVQTGAETMQEMRSMIV
jgi:hypothetical protein